MTNRAVMSTIAGLILVLGVLSQVAGADIVQPISVQLREQEPNTFLVRWSVPQTYPARAMPEPVLPDDCRPQGDQFPNAHHRKMCS